MNDMYSDISELPELTDSLFNISSVILSTDNNYEQDRWGALLGMEILGLRVNNYAFVFSHIEVDEYDDGDSMRELEEIVELETLLNRAKYNHDCYYEHLPVHYVIENAAQLKSSTAKVCNLLDKYYNTPKGFISTPPSSILPIITKKIAHESGKEWAWFNKTLYLTQSKIGRTLLNRFDVFDNSLFEIFKSLKFNVKKVSLIGFNDDLSLIDNIKNSVHSQQIRDTEQSIRSKSYELETVRKKANDLEISISDLKSKLGALQSEKIIGQQ